MNKKRIKVLLIIDYIFSTMGGTENQIIKIVNNIDKNRFDMSVLCLHETEWVREQQGIINCTIRSFNYNVFNHKDMRNLMALRHIYRHIREVKPDIVITFFKASYIVGVLLSRLAGTRSIISTRRDLGLWLDGRSLPLLRLANRFVTGMIVNAHVIKDLVMKEEGVNAERIDVIYNGIEISDFIRDEIAGKKTKEKLGIPFGSPVVGIVAGLRPMKRHDTFLRAAQRINAVRQDVHFVIVGNGPLRKKLEDLTDKLNIAEVVHFIDWQSDIRSTLSCFDIGVNCSTNEGLSNAIMEYMACGIPCVVSRLGGNPELIENNVNGYLFDEGDDAELSRRLLDLIDNEDKRQIFVRNSRDKILSMMTMEKMIDNYEQYFDHLIASSREERRA